MKLNPYLLYHIKWQSCWIVVYPVLVLSNWLTIPLWLGTILANLVGACGFWYVDNYIFSLRAKQDANNRTRTETIS